MMNPSTILGQAWMRRRARAESAPAGTGAAGFTITEFVFAVSVVGCVLVGFTAAANTATLNFRHFRNLSQAVAIADSITEQVLIMDSSDDALKVGRHVRHYNRIGNPSRRLGDRFYKAVWTVTNYEDVPGIRRIDVTVSWQEKHHVQEVSWTTYRN